MTRPPIFQNPVPHRPRIKIPVSGINMTALCDTGSTHTLIDQSMYMKLPRLTPLHAAPRVQSLTNEDLPLVGACAIKLAEHPCEVLVCENLGVDVLLGMNVLQQSVIDLLNGVVVLGDQKFPIMTTPELFRTYATTCLPQLDSAALNELLRTYQDVFSSKETPVGIATGAPQAVIDTGMPRPLGRTHIGYLSLNGNRWKNLLEKCCGMGLFAPPPPPGLVLLPWFLKRMAAPVSVRIIAV